MQKYSKISNHKLKMESNKKQKVEIDLTGEEDETNEKVTEIEKKEATEIKKEKEDEEEEEDEDEEDEEEDDEDEDDEDEDDIDDIDVDNLTKKEILGLQKGFEFDEFVWDVATRPPARIKETEKFQSSLYFRRAIRYFVLPIGGGKTKRVKYMSKVSSRTEILDFIANYYFLHMRFLTCLIGRNKQDALKEIIFKNHMAMDPKCDLDFNDESMATKFGGFEISENNEWTLLIRE